MRRTTTSKPVRFPKNFPPTATTWEEALAGYRFLRDGRGELRREQIELVERQLRKEAEALFEVVEQVKAHSLDAIKRRLDALGVGNDSLIRGALLPATALAKHDRGTTSFIHLAHALVGAANYLHDGTVVYREWVEREHGGKTTGRDPNMALEWLLSTTKQLGISDAEVARRLATANIFPNGPGTDEPDLAVRWVAVIKTARARTRII